MSSFGSSLINKSGKKVVPKAAGRRRPGVAPALAVQDAASSSARSSVEPSQTPQPDPLASHSVPPPGLPTPEATQIPTNAATPSDSVPVLHISAPARGVDGTTSSAQHGLSQMGATGGSTVADSAAIPLIPISSDSAAFSSSSGVRRRNVSPGVEIVGSSKRRRLISEDLPTRTASPPAPSNPLHAYDDGEIPVIQVSKRTPPRSTAKSSNAATSADEKHAAQNGLVQYEWPNIPEEGQPSASTAKPRASRPAIAPLLMATITGPKPRAKGTRRNQWQVTTPGDLAPARSRDEAPRIEQTDSDTRGDNDLIAVVGPKMRKIRKDKGIKKGPRIDMQADEDEEDILPIMNGTRSTRSRTSRAEQDALASAATRGRAIAPHPAPTPSPTAEMPEEEEPGDSAPQTTGTSARLRNAQKRRAKQIAADSARSRALASGTAAAIDDAVAQSIEGRASQLTPSTSNPLFRVQVQEASRSRRSNSATTDSTDITEMTEGGTKQRKRYSRQATPPGNETVFIAEKVTPMISLVGRDTENRVGMRSTTEMRMRTLDWKQLKQQHDDEMRQAAILKGSRKTNNFAVIFGRTDTPLLEVKPTPASGAEEDEDGDDLERAVAQREKHFGKSQRAQLTLVNGEHRLDEATTRRRNDEEDIESQVGDMEPADEDDLKKRHFNVHTFVKWKRRDPAERVYQSTRWNDEETEKFYEALRCCGVDFGSMAEWFPQRIRRSLKRKFNIEERVNPERINQTLDAHMMMLATGSGGDDGTGWDMAQFHANGAGYDLRDPREVEEQLERTRAEREVEIEAARKEFEAERRNQKLAGVQHSDDEEEEEGSGVEESEEEEDEEEVEGVGDMITRVQKELTEKKRKERDAVAAATEAGFEQDGDSDDQNEDDEDDADDEILPTMEEDDEGQYGSDEEPADWDD